VIRGPSAGRSQPQLSLRPPVQASNCPHSSAFICG
jgi:hypothetical protein